MNWIKGKVETAQTDTTMTQYLITTFAFLHIYRKDETCNIT